MLKILKERTAHAGVLMPFSRRSRGFTLIELMIVVIIVAILAAIAYPNYAKYVLRSRRVDGHEMMIRVAAAEERYYTNFNKYTATLSDLGFTSGASQKGYYLITAANGATATAQSYTLTATPQGVQAPDSCHELTLTDTGVKLAPHDTAANGKCW